MNGEKLKLWLNQTLQQSIRFVFFLDDVWGGNAEELFEGLDVVWPVRNHSNSKVIVGSRDQTALLKMGVGDKYTITMDDLTENESWKLLLIILFLTIMEICPQILTRKRPSLCVISVQGFPLQ